MDDYSVGHENWRKVKQYMGGYGKIIEQLILRMTKADTMILMIRDYANSEIKNFGFCKT